MNRLLGILILLATSGIHVPALAQVAARIKIDDATLINPDDNIYSAPVGRKLHLGIEVEKGEIVVAKMTMLPNLRPGFDYYAKERKATFGSEFAGTYVFVAFVTDGTGREDGTDIASAIVQYGDDAPPVSPMSMGQIKPDVPVNRARISQAPAPMQSALPAPAMRIQAAPANPVAARVQALTNEVKSNNFAVEAGQVASLFTMRAGQLETGDQQSSNEFRRVGNLYQASPGNNLAGWYTFFVGMSGLFDELQALGSFGGSNKQEQNARRAASLRNAADYLRAISQ